MDAEAAPALSAPRWPLIAHGFEAQLSLSETPIACNGWLQLGINALLKGKGMAPRVLVVDDDLDTHQFLRDLLEINFENVEIDKALDRSGMLKKLREAEHPYDLVLLDYCLEGNGGTDAVGILNTEFPNLFARMILLNGSPEVIEADERVKGVPNVRKPFSLDTLSDTLKKTCSTNRNQ